MPPQTSQQSFPQTQRELVGLALHRGARRPGTPPTPGAATQRDRVRLALALGIGAPKGAVLHTRRGIYR